LEHVERALRLNADNLRARDLQSIVLRRVGRAAEADALLETTAALDPLDWWARQLRGEKIRCNTQTRLDLAHDCIRAGFFSDALAVLDAAAEAPDPGTAPLVAYTAAWVCRLMNDRSAAERWERQAGQADPDYCFPARLEEIHVLRSAMAAQPRDARARYYLGNLFYDRRRHREAIALWEQSARLAPDYAVVWRNLGIGFYNIEGNAAKAQRAYNRARAAAPGDARVLYERDQLQRRLGKSVAQRLRELRRHPALVAARDDLTLEFCALLNQSGRHAEALTVLAGRRFQPWEGGEGLALGQYTRAHLALGRASLEKDDPEAARGHFEAAMSPPENLGEVRHLLAPDAELQFWLGCAQAGLGNLAAARRRWQRAASFGSASTGATAIGEWVYWAARAEQALGRQPRARRHLQALLAAARRLAAVPATIDYFATSLPTMLLFDDDLNVRQKTTAQFIEAAARHGLGEISKASRFLGEVLRRDPAHALAADFLAMIDART
jgi:tetratricopeptide (TPR) repeat protein